MPEEFPTYLKKMMKSNLLTGSKQVAASRAVAATIAVLGTGSIGSRHLGVLARVKGIRPLAVPLRASRRAALEKEGFSICGNLREASREGATCAVIATDTARHVGDALEAIDLGFHLLVEKPMAADAVQARRLAVRAVEAGRIFFVGYVLRFSKSLGEFRARLPEVGRLHSVEIECRSYLPDWRPDRDYRTSYSARADQGGVLRDLIHEVDYAGWIFGWPEAVQGRLRNLGRLGIEAEESAEFGWEAPGGFPVSIGLDYLTRPPRRRMTASGERGTIEWDGITGTVRLSVEGSPWKEWKSAQSRNEMFAAQARAFLQASGPEGETDPRLATAEEGVKALAVCDAARRASQTRKQEAVSYA